MVEFIIQSKTYQLPTSYDELTFEQFTRLRASKDDSVVELLAILLNCKEDELANISVGDYEMNIEPFLGFMKNDFDFIYPLPNYFKTKSGIECSKPSVLRGTFGQKIAFEQAINKAVKSGASEFDVYEEVLCIYFYSAIANKPFGKDYMSVREEIMGAKITDVLPFGAFFLKSLNKLNGGKSRPSRQPTQSSRLRQGLTGSIRLVVLELLFRLQKCCIYTLRKFSSWITNLSMLSSFTKKSKPIAKTT